VELVALEDSSAFYEIHGDGLRYRLSWAASDDGILAYDRDGDGQILERGEISFVDYVDGARTDLEGLRHFDTNGDNQLTSEDVEWSKFRVWQDLDGDGISDPGELRTLDEAGIHSISLVSSGEAETLPDGTQVLGRGTYATGSKGSPTTRELLDVSFRVAPWGFRETGNGVEIRWTEDEASLVVFVVPSEDPVILDLAAAGYRVAVGGAGADRFINTTAARLCASDETGARTASLAHRRRLCPQMRSRVTDGIAPRRGRIRCLMRDGLRSTASGGSRSAEAALPPVRRR